MFSSYSYKCPLEGRAAGTQLQPETPRQARCCLTVAPSCHCLQEDLVPSAPPFLIGRALWVASR